MAVVMLPIDVSSGAPVYTAQQTRDAFSALTGFPPSARPLGARSGPRAGTSTSTVFLSGGGSTTWNVAAHSGVIDTQSPIAAGPYFYATDGTDTGAITAADATNPRVDIVWVAVNDTVQDSSGLRNGVVTYQAGTAASSPVAPTPTNARAMILAQINVPHSGGGAPSVSWVANFSAAPGGILPVLTSATLPASPVEGQFAYDMTNNCALFYNGSAWKSLPLGFIGSVLGPASQLNFTTSTTVVTKTVSVIFGRNYRIGASVNWQKTTATGNVTGTLLETTSGFSPTLIPTASANNGDLSSGNFNGVWTPNSGQTSAVWQINCSSSTASMRVDVNCASIMIDDIGS